MTPLLTDAQRRALMWLPPNGSCADTRKSGIPVGVLRALANKGLADRPIADWIFGWHLTPAGIARRKAEEGK